MDRLEGATQDALCEPLTFLQLFASFSTAKRTHTKVMQTQRSSCRVCQGQYCYAFQKKRARRIRRRLSATLQLEL